MKIKKLIKINLIFVAFILFPLIILASEHEGAGHTAHPSFSITVFMIQVAAFVLLIFVLIKFVFSFILEFIEKRSEKIKNTFTGLGNESEEILSLTDSYKKKMNEIAQEVERQMNEAVDQGKKISENVASDALKTKDIIKNKVETEIGIEKEKALMEMRNDIVGLSIASSNQMLKNTMTEETQNIIVENFIKELKAIKVNE